MGLYIYKVNWINQWIFWYIPHLYHHISHSSTNPFPLSSQNASQFVPFFLGHPCHHLSPLPPILKLCMQWRISLFKLQFSGGMRWIGQNRVPFLGKRRPAWLLWSSQVQAGLPAWWFSHHTDHAPGLSCQGHRLWHPNPKDGDLLWILLSWIRHSHGFNSLQLYFRRWNRHRILRLFLHWSTPRILQLFLRDR